MDSPKRELANKDKVCKELESKNAWSKIGCNLKMAAAKLREMRPARSWAVNNFEKFNECYQKKKWDKLAQASFSLNCVGYRKLLRVEMERLPLVWIEDDNKNIPIILATVQAKVAKLFPVKTALIILEVCTIWLMLLCIGKLLS